MRLTLRTLLAYLDDTLEPAQAKLIGQKVAESEAAQELIGRIKQVTRRRRLTTPPLTGPGAKFDPNTIAEYLDNVLPGEQVAELEETCLASDVHLAEVSACHQVLTLFLGEPALVPPTARQRMYGLIQGREAIPNRKVSAPAAAAGESAADSQEDETLLGTALSRLGGDSLQWLVVATALCLLLGAGITIWMSVASPARPAIAPKEPPTKVAAADLIKTQEQNPPIEPKPAEPKIEPLPTPKLDPAEATNQSPPKTAVAPE